MKKKIVLILIALSCMLVFTPNANAKTNAVVVYKNYPGTGSNKILSGIEYAADGNKSIVGRGKFKIYNEYIRMNDHDYKAWCVDPSLHAKGGASYTCTPLKDYGLQYLYNNKTGDETIDSTAFRFYAIYAGIGMTATDMNGNEIEHSSLNYPKAALIRYLQVRNGNSGVIAEYGNDYTQFLRGNTAAIEAAYNLATAASLHKQTTELAQATSGDGSGLKYTRTSNDATSVTYNVTSTFPMKREEMEFTCDNCASVDILSWSEYSVTIKVNQLPGEEGCKFIVNAIFKRRGMFGCYGGEGNQFLVIMVDDPEQAKFPFEGHNPTCGDECCEEGPLNDDLQGNISNCCEETTHSYVKEYDLDELFCYHEGLQVPYYWEKCGADAYKLEEVNDYCDMYCTERVTIDVPGAITAKSGRYFTLSKNPVGNTTSPYIQGFKRCRIRIKYDLWEKDYVDKVKKEIEEYNKYQKAKAFEETYKDLLDAGYNSTFTATINCSASVSVGKCNCSRNPTTGKTSCTDGCSDSSSTSLSCTIKYRHHNLNTAFFNDYYGVKLQNDAREVDDHKSVLIKYDPSGSVTGRSDYATDMGGVSGYAADQSTVDLSDCTSKIASKESQVGASCSSGCGSDSDNWSCSLDYSELQAHIRDVTGIHNKYLSEANTANGNYMSHAADAKTLEEKIKKCNNYFNEVSAEEMYDFNPSMSFRYTQLYRDDNGESQPSVIGISFKETPGCVITGPEKGNITYEGGMDTADPRYSPIYRTGELITKDFASTGLSLATSSEGFRAFLDAQYDAPKIFTHDARYKAVCEWEEDPNNVNTLVPNGAVSEEGAIANFTRHEYEYKVFLTTYDGTFETDWSVSNVGENAKFDDYITSHGGSTCAGNNPTKNEMFSCTLHVEYEIVYVGKCNGTTVNPDDCDPVKDVEGLFQFKVADPGNIFPTGTTTDTGAQVAKNWTNTSKGQAVKAEIEQSAKRGLTYSPERESYKFHLTPEIMRHIKNYNVTRNSGSIGGYSDFNMTCDCPSEVQTNTLIAGGKGCTKCRSNLLSDLANNTISYEGQSYTVRTWASQKSIDQVRNESHWR